jgi:teichuronic acid biosynthesis glycosyltransferase TuaG
MKPFISIIIPTYNRKNRLKRAIESVLCQTFQNFELLICDDGSTDESHEMVARFGDPRIRWITEEHSGGPAKPRNRGIKEAKGEWFAFLDSDDLWKVDKLEKQLHVLKSHNVAAVCTNANIMLNGITSERTYFKDSKDKLYTLHHMLHINLVICSSMMIHNSITKTLGGFPEDLKFKGIEDYVLWASASILTDIYYIHEPLVIYRDEPYDSIRGEVTVDEKTKHNRTLLECLKRAQYVKHDKLFYLFSIFISLIKQNISFFVKKLFLV